MWCHLSCVVCWLALIVVRCSKVVVWRLLFVIGCWCWLSIGVVCLLCLVELFLCLLFEVPGLFVVGYRWLLLLCVVVVFSWSSLFVFVWLIVEVCWRLLMLVVRCCYWSFVVVSVCLLLLDRVCVCCA